MSSITEESLMDERAYEDAMEAYEEMTERCEECDVSVEKGYIYQCVNCDTWVCGDCVWHVSSENLCTDCFQEGV